MKARFTYGPGGAPETVALVDDQGRLVEFPVLRGRAGIDRIVEVMFEADVVESLQDPTDGTFPGIVPGSLELAADEETETEGYPRITGYKALIEAALVVAEQAPFSRIKRETLLGFISEVFVEAFQMPEIEDDDPGPGPIPNPDDSSDDEGILGESIPEEE